MEPCSHLSHTGILGTISVHSALRTAPRLLDLVLSISRHMHYTLYFPAVLLALDFRIDLRNGLPGSSLLNKVSMMI